VALFKNCIKRFSGALKGGLILASSCAIAASLQAPVFANIFFSGSSVQPVGKPKWNDWNLSSEIGLRPQYYDKTSNTLYVLEANTWDGNGPNGFSLVGRNPVNGALLSSFRLDQDSPYNWSSSPAGYNSGILQSSKLANGNWLISGFFNSQPYKTTPYTELRTALGSLIWRTEEVGGRYPGNRPFHIVVSDDNNFAFVSAGTDCNGAGIFGSGIARIRLSDGTITKSISQISGSGPGFNFFKGHNNLILVDTSSSIQVFDQDLNLVDELPRPYINGEIINILQTNGGGYIFIGHHAIANQHNPKISGRRNYAFAAGYSANSNSNNLTHPDWLIDLASQDLNVLPRDAQYLPDGTIGIIGTTCCGSSWLGGLTAGEVQTYNEIFPGLNATEGFFIDQAGDIVTWEARGFNGADSGTYTIDIASHGASTSVPGPLPVLGAAAAFGFSRKLRRRIQGR
jgi:hypothetical protein